MTSPVHRACPVCSGSEHSFVLQKGALTLVRCRTCSMVFASPVPSDLIDGQFYESTGRDYYTSPEKLAGDFAAVRFRRELAIFRRYCPSGAVLDVGCNTGAFLHQLCTACPGAYSVLGLDVSGPALEHAASLGLDVRAGALDDPGIKVGPFDAITFWAVLEHVERPGGFLARAATLLRPGGHVFVLVPNWGSLAIRLLRWRYRYIMPEHLNYFTAATLRRMCSGVSELEFVELRSSHFNPVVMWQDLVRSRPEVPAAERAALLGRTNRWKTNPRWGAVRRCYEGFEWLLGKLGWADNLVVVLRRRSAAA